MLTVTDGLVDYQVLQRDVQNSGHAVLRGTCGPDASGTVEARVLRHGFPLTDWEWRPVGMAEGGIWSAHMTGLPVGGPYQIEIRAAQMPSETVILREILVGDLWVLAGQSNMEGVGDLIDVEPPSPLVHSFDMADNWRIAEEPLHWLCDSIDEVHTPQAEPFRTRNAQVVHATRTKGAGLGLPFAVEMVRRTGVPVGLLCCAHGGTSMAQWSPKLRDQGGESLYGSMYRRFKKAGGKVRGVLWYQGESDANPTDAKMYMKNMRELIESIRRDFGDPALPFYYVQLGRLIQAPGKEYPLPWNQIQEAQRLLASEIPHTAVVPAIDLELDDAIHIGTQGLKRLGRRLAKVACSQLFGDTTVTKGPTLCGVSVEDGQIRVAFEGVNSNLSATGRITGFGLYDRKGNALPLIYKVTVDPLRPSEVLLHLTETPPKDVHLWYGFGLDPCSNLADTSDMAVPVFGPIPL